MAHGAGDGHFERVVCFLQSRELALEKSEPVPLLQALGKMAGNRLVIRGGVGRYTMTILGAVFYSLTGISSSDVREFTNKRLEVRGVIATMFDPRGRHAREVLEDVQTRFGLAVLDPPIPKTVRFAEAPGRGVSILEHASKSAGAQAYREIARALHADIAGPDTGHGEEPT